MERFYFWAGSIFIGALLGYIVSLFTCKDEKKNNRNYNDYDKKYNKKH